MVRLPVSSPRARSRRTRAVDGGQAVGQGSQGGDAAGRGGGGGGGDGLSVLVAGFAQGGAHIDQTGTQDSAVAVNRHRAVGPSQAGSEVGDDAAAHQQVALLVQAGGRIDQACAEEQDI